MCGLDLFFLYDDCSVWAEQLICFCGGETEGDSAGTWSFK